MEDVHVLWWKEGDGSSCGVIRAYTDIGRASEDMDLLVFSQSSKEFFLETVPVYRDAERIPQKG